ncbi:MAG: ATP-binding cassette subfamily B multidrug efflux pump [Cellvibrionaceae bacterium]|jgi:ATP-binding cassette subfamily B multidrug efflux pump
MRRQTNVNDMAGVSGRSSWESIKRLFNYMRDYQWQLLVVLLTVITYVICYVLGPYLLGRAIDDYILKGDLPGLTQIVAWMLAVYTGMWLSGIISGRVMAQVAQRTLERMRKDLFGQMQKLSLKYYDQQSAGDLMSRLTNDMDALNQLLTNNLVSFMRSLGTLVGMLIGMVITSLILTGAALIVIPIMFGTMFLIMRKLGPRFRELQMNLGALNGLMEENITGQRVVIAYGQEGASIDDFMKANETARDTAVNANLLANLMGSILFVLGNLNVTVVVAAGAFLALGAMPGVVVSIGAITTMIDYTRRFSFPLMEIGQTFNTIVSALAGAERIFDVIDMEPHVLDKANAAPLDHIEGEIVFDDVDFSYISGQPILKNISLTAKPGEMIALVGPTGAGKTTIINVLTRFYDIEKGTIMIDGSEIRDVQQDSLRQQLGIVLQDTYLFSDTVLENIRYGRLDATDAEVMEAAKLANADGFISRLPDGYGTELSERAGNISQGQRQLLAIARAILADPRILILDEATSSVDTRTEVQIQEALLNLMAGRTSFVIAHRLSTIREADQILVLKDGEIIERGTHETLLDERGFYDNLYRSQFKGTAVV